MSISTLSIGWREGVQIGTWHTSLNQFLSDYSKPSALIANGYIMRAVPDLGGIDSFNNIFATVLACNKLVKPEVLISVLHDLCKVGKAYYFEHSYTYMIKGSS